MRASMYGLIGKMRATPGTSARRCWPILLESTEAMPGCLSYVVAQDPTDAEAIWITEVWTGAASHTIALAAGRAAGHREGAAADRRLRQPHRNGAGGWSWIAVVLVGRPRAR